MKTPNVERKLRQHRLQHRYQKGFADLPHRSHHLPLRDLVYRIDGINPLDPVLGRSGGWSAHRRSIQCRLSPSSPSSQKRNVETSPNAPSVKATASISGTRNSRSLALAVSINTMAQLRNNSLSSRYNRPSSVP